ADEPEVYGLLALMLLHDSRREARVVDGRLVPLAEQDRSRHDGTKVEVGHAALERALALRPEAGPYVLQAAIASLQAEEEIDWDEVALLYERLERLTGSPVVALNRAAAVAEAGAPERALELVDSLDLGDYRYLHSTRAELLRRLGRDEEARAAFECALRLATTDPERRFLARRLAGLRHQVSRGGAGHVADRRCRRPWSPQSQSATTEARQLPKPSTWRSRSPAPSTPSLCCSAPSADQPPSIRATVTRSSSIGRSTHPIAPSTCSRM